MRRRKILKLELHYPRTYEVEDKRVTRLRKKLKIKPHKPANRGPPKDRE